MLVVYGIKNCDTVRKARKWLDSRDVDYRFHDYRSDGLEPDLLDRFESTLGWEAMLNRRGTSWRRLTDDQRADLEATKAKQLMLDTPTLIKRPIVDTGSEIIIGFSEQSYLSLL